MCEDTGFQTENLPCSMDNPENQRERRCVYSARSDEDVTDNIYLILKKNKITISYQLKKHT